MKKILVVQILKNLFKPNIKQFHENVINIWEHKTWGDGIYWSDFDNGFIYGKMGNAINIGDILADKINSRIKYFKVVYVECNLKDYLCFWIKVKPI